MGVDNLAEMQCLCDQARLHEIPILLAGCGVGPLGHRAQQASIQRILALADQRIYRDQNSLRLAQSLGIDTEADQVSDDPANTWLWSQKQASSDTASESPYLLLGLRDWPLHQYAAGLSLKQAHTAKYRLDQAILSVLSALCETHPELSIRPFPMCCHHVGGDDRWYYRQLFSRASPLLKDRVDCQYLSREPSAEISMAAFQQARAALTMRFHALVFAAQAKVPTVALDYTLGQGKVAAFAAQHQVPLLSVHPIEHGDLLAALEAQLNSPS
jgi:polysaccharide pyruvyl transferase WcaK-like protein